MTAHDGFGCGPPPEDLTEMETRIWERLRVELGDKLDYSSRSLLRVVVQAGQDNERIRLSLRELPKDKDGDVGNFLVRDPNGGVGKNPLFELSMRAAAHYASLLAQIGGSPTRAVK